MATATYAADRAVLVMLTRDGEVVRSCMIKLPKVSILRTINASGLSGQDLEC